MMQRIREIGSGLGWLICAVVLAAILAQHETRADTWGVATITSHHFDRSAGHNERNFGVGIEQDVRPDLRAVVGFYDNSFNRMTTYIGVAFMPLHLGNFSFGLVGVLASGYGSGGRFLPVALPVVQYERNGWGANIGVVPGTKESPGVVGLQLKWRLQ